MLFRECLLQTFTVLQQHSSIEIKGLRDNLARLWSRHSTQGKHFVYREMKNTKQPPELFSIENAHQSRMGNISLSKLKQPVSSVFKVLFTGEEMQENAASLKK